MNKDTLQLVLECPRLPTLPTVAMELLQMSTGPDTTLSDFEQVVQRDPALAARLLRTVNSGFYALSQPCTSLSRALSYLGTCSVKALALGFSLPDTTQRGEGRVDLNAFWSRSLATAIAARQLGEATEGVDPETAFVTGLLLDIGVLAFDSALEGEYARALDAAASNPKLTRRVDRERAQLGVDHAEIGQHLADRWQLPEAIGLAIGGHHTELTQQPEAPMLTRVVAAASLVADVLEGAGEASMMETLPKLLPVPLEELPSLLARTIEQAKDLSGLLDANGAIVDPQRVTDAARTERVRCYEQQSDSLHAVIDTLNNEADTEPGTGLRSRRYLDYRIRELWNRARDEGQPLALILLQREGDDLPPPLARSLGEGLRAAAEPDGLAARYDRQTLAVLLPGFTAARAAQAASRLHDCLCTLDPAEPGAVQVGVAIAEPGQPAWALPERLVDAAANALCAASASGGDGIRIFRPRPAA